MTWSWLIEFNLLSLHQINQLDTYDDNNILYFYSRDNQLGLKLDYNLH
jgi:hypothetical protein